MLKEGQPVEEIGSGSCQVGIGLGLYTKKAWHSRCNDEVQH